MLPSELGFKMPAEWTRHQRTFMEWPLIDALWPKPFEEVLPAYAEIVKKILEFEPVTLIVKAEVSKQAAEFCDSEVEIIELEHNDSWIRDNGPTFLTNSSGKIAAVNWMFNAWGGKYPFELDNMVASSILARFKVPRFDAPFIMEGGSIHVDGEGTLLTTEECLLNKNRNTNLTKPEIEVLLKLYLGIEKVIWLKQGIFGDDTDGHVDNVACFAAPGVIIIQTCANKADQDYKLSKENIEILKKTKDAKGRAFKIIEIEKPEPYYYEDTLLTLSYLNFYFVNGGIILPVFGGKNIERDFNAENILKGVFPDRKIVTVNGLIVARGGGNVHCLTQQMPEGEPAIL
jgi:agmatine deiminase